MRFAYCVIPAMLLVAGCVGSHPASSVKGNWRAKFSPTCDSAYLIVIDDRALTYRDNGVSHSVPIELVEHMSGATATVYLDPKDRSKTAPLIISLSGDTLEFSTSKEHAFDLALVPYLTMQPLHRCP